MSGAAQQELLDEAGYEAAEFQATGTESVTPLKQVVSERLEAHRRRRAEAVGQTRRVESETATAAPRRTGATRVREAVAERYKNSVTYREFLAQEAERALEQAQAEAEMAARKVQAVAEAQMQLMEELEQWNQPEPGPRETAIAQQKAEIRDSLAHAFADIAVAATELMPPATYDPEAFAAGLTVRMYDGLAAQRSPAEPARRVAPAHSREHEEHEHETLDAEIAFRRAPEFDPFIPQPVGISGNLIEFPRQLVAARKVRPRLAEGPLREESEPEPQLRIFEVEPELISTVPAEPEGAPEWQGMLLDNAARPKVQTPAEEHFHPTLQPQTARMEVRLMAAAVDGCCIAGAFVGFATVVVELCGESLRALPLPLVGASVGGALLALFVLYQLLFFTLNDATPGMRYARIALCTFGDDNPSRSAMRRRVLATLLSACPLGIGLAWAWMDEDGLGWHDRISRMYQRGY